MKTESAGKTERIGVFMAETVWSLLPPVITIILALATKEVYMSLAIGIFIGAFMFAGFSFTGAIDTMFAIMSDKIGSNVYILVFWCFWESWSLRSRSPALRRHMVIMQRVRSREREALFSLR